MLKTLSYAVAFATIFLTGCDQKEYQTPAERGVGNSSQSVQEPSSQSSVTVEEENELKALVADMKSKDPTIVDAYYSVGEDGQKILNVVKEDEKTAGSGSEASGSSGLSTFMWAMAGGLTANALFNAFSNNRGNMSAVANQYRPMNTNRTSYSGYTAQKQMAQSGYRGSIDPNKFQPKRSIDTSKKLTPVTKNSNNVRPLSQDAYRNTSTRPVETRVIQKQSTSSYSKPKPSIFKRSTFGRRR